MIQTPPLNDIVNECLPQLTAQAQACNEVSMQFGYFCLIAGAIIGALTGYYYSKRKYQQEEEDGSSE